MQRNLLDTHTLIWFINGSKILSNKVRYAIEAPGTVNFVSIASLWEIAVKVSLGKLELKTTYSKIYDLLIANAFELLPITFEDTRILSKGHHFSSYEVTVLW